MIVNCRITDNEAWGNGGGISISGGTVRECVVSGNRSFSTWQPLFPEGGGGIRCEDGASVRIIGCTLRNDESIYRAGGGVWLFNDEGEGEIANIVLLSNH